MKNLQKGFLVPLLIGIIALLLVAGGVYLYKDNADKQVAVNATQTPTPTQTSTPTPSPSQTAQPIPVGSAQYDNLGIAFQYPSAWEIPHETFYGSSGLGSIFFDSSVAQPFSVLIEQDTNPQGTGLMNETFDQMIARFKTNDKYIYSVKDISVNGLNGKELVYLSAVTNQPYHVDAYFPFKNNSYVTLSADFQVVSQDTFDKIISTFKWDSSTGFRLDAATGMAVYKNNNIQFEYPEKFNTNFASLIVQTTVGNTDTTKMDVNGCYTTVGDMGMPISANILTVGGVKFCATKSTDIGAGQSNTTYSYTTFRSGNAYTISYLAETTNGCDVYKNSPDLSAANNLKYNQCQDFFKNYDSLVMKPIQTSISTFKFIN